MRVLISSLHHMIKFPTWEGVGLTQSDQKITQACYFFFTHKGRFTESLPIQQAPMKPHEQYQGGESFIVEMKSKMPG